MRPAVTLAFLWACSTSEPSFVAQIYERFHRLIYKIAGQFAATPEDRKEIVQLSLVKLVQSSDKLQHIDEAKLAAYIAKVTRNTALNYMKHTAVVLKHITDLESETELSAPRLFRTPEDFVLLQERREELRQAIGRLSESDQLVIIGKLVLEMSDRELAEMLGCKPQSVSMKLTRAKRRARAEIARLEEDDGS